MCRSGEIGRRTGLKIQRASRLVSVRLRPSAPLSRMSYIVCRISYVVKKNSGNKSQNRNIPRMSYRVKEIKSNSLQLLLQILILSGRGNPFIELKI